MNTFLEKLETNNLHFKLITNEDASFILKLRTDTKLCKISIQSRIELSKTIEVD